MIQYKPFGYVAMTLAAALALALTTGCPSSRGGGGGGGDSGNVNENTGDGNVNENTGDENVNENTGDGNVNENTGDGNVNENTGDGGQNQSPTANAGSDRTVSGGDVVQLDGAASADADNDALTYSWTQTGGDTTVVLDGADTTTPSFVAPTASDTLTFQLTVDDGNGATGIDSVVITVTIPLAPPVLFVVSNNKGITSYTHPETLSGDVVPNTSLPLGSVTQVFQARAVVVTQDGDLIISGQSDQIFAYNDGFNATGETVVDRVIEGNNTLLNTPISFAYDTVNDTLYVGNAPASEGLLVFNNVSSEGFDGEVVPDRRFGPGDRIPFGTQVSIAPSYQALAFDTLGNLYAVDQSGANANFSRILVFADPDTAENLADPVRTLEAARVSGERVWGQIEDIAIDLNNTMYIVDGDENVVVLDEVDTLDGEVEPSRTIAVQVNGVDLQGVSISSEGVGFLADTGNHAVHVLLDIDTLDGATFPNRSIEGNDTDLRSPRDMFLFEPEP